MLTPAGTTLPPRTAYYGWAYDPTTNGLIDEETGKRYTMSYEAIEE